MKTSMQNGKEPLSLELWIFRYGLPDRDDDRTFFSDDFNLGAT